MTSVTEVLQLCRLCLMKDQVNNPIFEEADDISQIFLKISACLPVKVSRDDSLPKKICDSCSYKLELFYDFLHSSTASEKQLITWLNRLGVDKLPASKVVNTLSSSLGSNVSPLVLKQEIVDVHSVDELSADDDLNITSESQDYDLQQQQLSYEGEFVEFQQDEFMDNDATNNIAASATITSKSSVANRKRSAAVMQADLDSEDEDNLGLGGSKMSKTEGANDSENDAEETFDIPSTSGDNDQPGPSGVGKGAPDTSVTFLTFGQLAVFTKLEDHIELLHNEDEENEDYIDEESVDSLSFYENIENLDYQLMKLIEEDNIKDILKPNRNSKPKTIKKSDLCSICGKNVTMLDKHLRLYHGTFKCDICITAFKTEDELEAHKELHGDNAYPCNECCLSFKKPIDYAYHSKEHCALKTYSCPICQFKTPSRGSIKIHIQHHEKDYKYTCEICNRGFITNSVYVEHVEGHAGIKKFQCDICFKTFLYKRYLMVHRKLNHKKILEGYEDLNECHVCQRKFSFEKSLVRHLSKIHGIGKDVSVDCTVCNKKIANPYNLKMHMRTHTGEKPYVCETCGKAFTKRVNLRRHLHNLHD